MVRDILVTVPASYGYRRVHAMMERQGVICNIKTVWRIMRRKGWLSSTRQRCVRPERRHEGKVAVPRPNTRWASDITVIKAWDGKKGRLAVIIDCADRMILAWRFGRRITGEALCEMVREAVFRRYGSAREQAKGLEFLTDNGTEYKSHRLQKILGLFGIVRRRTPRRSPESNGVTESFNGGFKRDYVNQNDLTDLAIIALQLPSWFEHYNEVGPHGSLGNKSPAQFHRDWKAKN